MSTPLDSPPGRVRSRWVKPLQLIWGQNQDLVKEQVAVVLVQEKHQGFQEANLAVFVFRHTLKLEAPGCHQDQGEVNLVREEVDQVREKVDQVQEDAQNQDQDRNQDQED